MYNILQALWKVGRQKVGHGDCFRRHLVKDLFGNSLDSSEARYE